jgi:hypothetical protein
MTSDPSSAPIQETERGTMPEPGCCADGLHRYERSGRWTRRRSSPGIAIPVRQNNAMCDLIGGEELVEGQRGEARLLAEQDGEGMAEGLAQPAGEEVPRVARPDVRGVEALGPLPDAGLAAAARVGAPLRPGVRVARGPLVRGEDRQAALAQALSRLGPPVGAIPEPPAATPPGQPMRMGARSPEKV